MLYSRSSSGGTSSSSGTYLPFFFRCRTHSVNRYSICPFTERKSSSAHAAMASYSFVESRSGTCFFRLSAISVQCSGVHDGLSVMVSAKNHQKIGNHGCFPLLIQRDDLIFHSGVPVPFPPYPQHHPRSSFLHQ